MSLTYRLFARRCAYIAKNCSEWAGDSLDREVGPGLETPVPLYVVRRSLKKSGRASTALSVTRNRSRRIRHENADNLSRR
jgi:hypothetical protein